MAGRHSEEIPITLTGTTPVKISWPPLAKIRGVRTFVGLFVNESDGVFYVTTDASSSTGPKIGSVAAADTAPPAGVYAYGEDVWVVAAASGGATSIKLAMIQAP